MGPSRTGFQAQDIRPTVDFTHRRVEQAELGHCLRVRSLLIHEAIVLVDGHRSPLIYVHIGAVDAQVEKVCDIIDVIDPQRGPRADSAERLLQARAMVDGVPLTSQLVQREPRCTVDDIEIDFRRVDAAYDRLHTHHRPSGKITLLLAVAFLAGGEEVLRYRVPAVAARPDVLARVDLVVGRARREIQRIAAEVTVAPLVKRISSGLAESKAATFLLASSIACFAALP